MQDTQGGAFAFLTLASADADASVFVVRPPPQEKLSGVVVVQSKSDMSHAGITLVVEGMVNMQLSSKSVGVFEAFYNSIKPVQLLFYAIDIAGPGKLPSGTTELPFEVSLRAKEGLQLYETYKGVFVNIEYGIRVDMVRGMLNKSLNKRIEFFIENEVSFCGRALPSGPHCAASLCAAGEEERGGGAQEARLVCFLFSFRAPWELALTCGGAGNGGAGAGGMTADQGSAQTRRGAVLDHAGIAGDRQAQRRTGAPPTGRGRAPRRRDASLTRPSRNAQVAHACDRAPCPASA